jgi:amino acid transporter
MLSLLFPSHLGRLAFFIRLIPLELLAYFGIGELTTVREWNGDRFAELAILALLIIYGVVFVFLPRVRDCAMPGWTLVFSAIPFVSSLYGLILLFGPSRPLSRLQSEPPVASEAPLIIPGSKCAACGKSLVVAADGVVLGHRALCNECSAKPRPS